MKKSAKGKKSNSKSSASKLRASFAKAKKDKSIKVLAEEGIGDYQKLLDKN